MVSRTQGAIIAVAVVALIYGASTMFKPKAVTDSTNVRFNAWVTYFRRQKGYTVEYHDFDMFADMVDEMYKPVGSPNPQGLMSNVFAKAIKVHSLGREFEGDEITAMMTPGSLDNPVTVYYDDDEDVMFFVGDAFTSRFFYAARAPDPTATYGYYTEF